MSVRRDSTVALLKLDAFCIVFLHVHLRMHAFRLTGRFFTLLGREVAAIPGFNVLHNGNFSPDNGKCLLWGTY